VSAEFPLGMRNFAGGDAAVVNQVMIGSGFFHHLAVESKGRRRGQNEAITAEMKSGCSRNVVKFSCLGGEIVCPVAGFDVVVIWTSVECNVAGNRGLAAIGVVGRFVGSQDVIEVVNFGIAVQFVDVAVFFLLDGADDRRVVILLGRKIWAWAIYWR